MYSKNSKTKLNNILYFIINNPYTRTVFLWLVSVIISDSFVC